MSNKTKEERFVELIKKSTDKEKAVETAIEVFLCLLEQPQTQTEIFPANLLEQIGIVAS